MFVLGGSASAVSQTTRTQPGNTGRAPGLVTAVKRVQMKSSSALKTDGSNKGRGNVMPGQGGQLKEGRSGAFPDFSAPFVVTV